MLDHPWLTMEAKYETRMSQEEFEEVINKSKNTMPSEMSKGAYVPGDAQTEYYQNAEMSKLTDSEGEYLPADDETETAAKTNNAFSDKLNSWLENGFDSDGSMGFSDDENPKRRNVKVARDLANGQNLNNSFGCYQPEDWEHLHVDKGGNPQFDAFK